MSKELSGNTKGLGQAELRAVQKLFQRSVESTEIISLDLAREMCELAERLRRRIGILIDRQGHIVEVILGTKDILFLPDLGRYRLGRGRLRTLRLVFTDLSNNQEQAVIPYDIYTDLERLRFDAVVSIRSAPNRTSLSYAYLVGVYDKADDPDTSIMEIKELARTAGVKIVDTVIQKRRADPKTYIGSGKLQELVIRCIRLGADMLIFDAELKPSQWRAITNSTELKVIDRSMLILDIFGQRAASSDGRLQVELAQLKYNLPRLVEKDGGLSRLSGGIGGRGPGETKLEIGRRRIRDRITELERRLDKVRESRELRRGRRRESQLSLVSIVGYTNVGKSTLFNLLTNSTVTVENKLFATLDPSQRRFFIPASDPMGAGGVGRTAILSDTVGFIRSLPQELETAFRATLEELYEATLLVHVVDAADPDAIGKYRAVRRILEQMNLGLAPELVVLNKVDRATEESLTPLINELQGIAISAANKIGIAELLKAIDERVPRVQPYASYSADATGVE